MSSTNKKLILLYGLVIIVVLSRLVPHPVNFTPVGALGLFAGAYLTRKSAWLVPLIVLLISDIFIGFYDPVSMFFVYLGFICSAVIGHYILKPRRTGFLIAGSSISAALIFFILSNFGTWLSGLLYPMTLSGLVECFILAIPFFGNSLAGTIIYSLVLFGIFEAFGNVSDKNNSTQAI